MNIKNICVLGGSGFVGRHLVHQLHEAGYNVLVPTSRRIHAKVLTIFPGVKVVEADVHDESVLSKLFDGMDAVINLVGILHEKIPGRIDKPEARRGSFHDTHIELPRKVVHACAEKGVRRLLHMSALPADPTAQSAYLRSKGAGEVIVMEAGIHHPESERSYLDGPKFVPGYGLEVTVFRPSVIFGREDTFLNMFARLIDIFPILPLANPNAKFQPVFVEDVARAYVQSINNRDTFGKRYELCGPKVYTLKELVQYVAKVKERRPIIIGLSERLSYLQAAVLEKLPGPLMTQDNFFSMKKDNVCQCPFPEIFGKPAALEAEAPLYLRSPGH